MFPTNKVKNWLDNIEAVKDLPTAPTITSLISSVNEPFDSASQFGALSNSTHVTSILDATNPIIAPTGGVIDGWMIDPVFQLVTSNGMAFIDPILGFPVT